MHDSDDKHLAEPAEPNVDRIVKDS
jgi:hypothetical protein